MGLQYTKHKLKHCEGKGSAMSVMETGHPFLDVSARDKELLTEMWQMLKKHIERVGVITFVR